jgi:endonuclease/exonuclease/phosphatase (EEP) superfamily protein YafD
MRRFFLTVIALLFGFSTLGVSIAAIGAVLGFTYPILDLLNHLQPFLFAGTLFCLLTTAIFVQHRIWRGLITSVAATGFFSSALIVVPEAVPALTKSFEAEPLDRPVYKLLTHNLFGLNYNADRVAAAIEAENPDILALQEMFPFQRNALHGLIAKAYPHFTICKGGKRANVAVYAKLPFVARRDGACTPGDDGRIARIFAKFEPLDQQSFTIVTTHLDWPVQISKFDDGIDLAEGFNLAFARQRGQFSDLGEALTKMPGPLLLAADLNSTAWSYALRDFADYTGLERHTRSLFTFPARFYIFGGRDTIPFIPLDHVMTRHGINVHEVRSADAAGSDHRSVVTLFSVAAE